MAVRTHGRTYVQMQEKEENDENDEEEEEEVGIPPPVPQELSESVNNNPIFRAMAATSIVQWHLQIAGGRLRLKNRDVASGRCRLNSTMNCSGETKTALIQ